jgi:hypothetical protein
VHEGKYLAEVKVILMEDEDGRGDIAPFRVKHDMGTSCPWPGSMRSSSCSCRKSKGTPMIVLVNV